MWSKVSAVASFFRSGTVFPLASKAVMGYFFGINRGWISGGELDCHLVTLERS